MLLLKEISMKIDESLIDFLKEYAKEANNQEYFLDYEPFYSDVSMPGGYARLTDRNGLTVLSVSVSHDPDGNKIPWCSSMPVHPASMVFLNLVAKVFTEYPKLLPKYKEKHRKNIQKMIDEINDDVPSEGP